jgi:hypothetical protein
MDSLDAATELGSGSPDDCYAWLTSTPNELVPETNNIIRSERLYGFNLVGRVKDLPLNRRPANESGCYVHNLFANDVKVNSWAMRLALPFMINGLQTWFNNLNIYISENKGRIENHL